MIVYRLSQITRRDPGQTITPQHGAPRETSTEQPANSDRAVVATIEGEVDV